MLISVLTTACHLSPSSAQVLQSILSHLISLRYILSSFSHPSLIYHVVSLLQVSHPKLPRPPVFSHTSHMFVHFLNPSLHRQKICFKTTQQTFSDAVAPFKQNEEESNRLRKLKCQDESKVRYILTLDKIRHNKDKSKEHVKQTEEERYRKTALCYRALGQGSKKTM